MLKSAYAHLSNADRQIWEAFQTACPGYFLSPLYDLHVGDGPELPDDLIEPWRSMAKELARRRIDVFAWHEGYPCIVEVKPRVGTTAVGQVITYRTLYRLQYPESMDPKMIIVCRDIDRDAQHVCTTMLIDVLCAGRDW